MKKIIFALISVVLTLIYLVVLGVLSYYVYKLNIIPNKYLIIAYTLIGISSILLIYNLFKSRIVVKIISGILLLLLTCLLVFITYYLNNTYHFLTKMKVDYDTLSYSVLVKNNSSYINIDDLNKRNIAYINNEDSSSVKKELNKEIKYNEVLDYEFTEFTKMLLSEGIDAIVLEESYINLAKEEIEGFSDNTRIIYTFTIKVKAHEEEEKKIDVTLEPFIIYISGIDQYGNVNSVRGRSDVNQLMVINPKTHHILIANTPRDYYVQLAGTTGLRDKLTHAGIYGIEKSISTIENLYGIDINHYIRINFDTLIKVVDVLGGVDIYSEKAFQPWTNSHVYINQGNIHLNGTEALAYARERKTYVDGDHHRGRNQQQIIEAIISKLTDTNTFLSKYNSILKTLEGSFQTDMDTSLITGFIKYQLDKMPSWKVDSVSVNGYSSWNYTYSMGYNYYLWVMEPDWNSVNDIKNKILEVLNEG